LAANSYHAHGAQFTQQYLANTFEQVHQACLLLIPGVLNRLNPRLLHMVAAGIVAQYLATLRHENSNYFSRIKTRDLNVICLEDSLSAFNSTSILNLNYNLILLSALWLHIPLITRKSPAYGVRIVLPNLNALTALPGYLPSPWNVVCTESASFKGGEY
jgi:hypothetical protein